MADRFRTPFGALAVDPERLTQPERVQLARETSGALQAATDPAFAWFGRSVARCLRGEPFLSAFGLEADGARLTVRRLLRQEQVQRVLVRLSDSLGSARASRILRGYEAAPDSLTGLVEEALSIGAPTSLRSFARARKRAK